MRRCSPEFYFIFSGAGGVLFSGYDKSQSIIYVLYQTVRGPSHRDRDRPLPRKAGRSWGRQVSLGAAGRRGRCPFQTDFVAGTPKSHCYSFNNLLIIDSFPFHFSLYINAKSNLQSLANNVYAKGN